MPRANFKAEYDRNELIHISYPDIVNEIAKRANEVHWKDNRRGLI